MQDDERVMAAGQASPTATTLSYTDSNDSNDSNRSDKIAIDRTQSYSDSNDSNENEASIANTRETREMIEIILNNLIQQFFHTPSYPETVEICVMQVHTYYILKQYCI